MHFFVSGFLTYISWDVTPEALQQFRCVSFVALFGESHTESLLTRNVCLQQKMFEQSAVRVSHIFSGLLASAAKDHVIILWLAATVDSDNGFLCFDHQKFCYPFQKNSRSSVKQFHLQNKQYKRHHHHFHEITFKNQLFAAFWAFFAFSASEQQWI